MGKVVCLLSGGIDSSTLLGKLLWEKNEVYPVVFNYGQKHSKEIEHAKLVAGHYGLELMEVDISGIKPLISKSSLTSDEPIPEGHYADESMKSTVVPNRNMIMISLAVGYAWTIGASKVCFAAHGGDHPIYSDCRPDFVKSINNTVIIGTEDRVRVEAPFVNTDKTEIVKLGNKIGVPFDKTWSCYKGKEKHCGLCGTCVERKESFEKTGVEDPTEYEG